MRVTLTEQEWRTAIDRARAVGAAFGIDQAAIVVARAAVEALGIAVPVVAAEVDAATAGPHAVRATAAPDPTRTAPEPVERPRRDLRLTSRIAAGIDGYCAHCRSVYGAEALAVMNDGNRLCPVHGTAVDDVHEVAEGRYHTARIRGRARTASAMTTELCGAPVGGSPCGRDAGHEGRHRPDRRDDS